MKNTIYFDAEFAPLLLVNEEQVGSNSIVINIEADSTADQSLLITMDTGTTTSLTVTPGQENSLAIDEAYWSLGGSTFVSLVKGGLTSNSITLIFPETINTDAALEETSNLTYTMTGSNTVTEQIDNLDDRVTTLEQGGGGNKIYTSTRIPTSSDTANEGDLWYQMNYISSGAFDFPDWGYTLPIVYDPSSFKLSDVRSSLELRFYDTVNDIYLYFLFLGGTNYSITYNVLGLTNTFDGFDKDTGELQVTTENEHGTTWTYWNYIPRWASNNVHYPIANPLGQGNSDHDMSPVVGTTTYNLYSILGYADYVSSGRYRVDGFRLITNGFETSWQYGVANEYNVIGRWVYKENNWQVADYVEGEGITIKNGIISANGGAIVQVNPIVASGTQLATINGTSIYAPTVSANQTLASGTEIGSVTVGGTSTTLYAPTPQSVSASQTLASGTEVGSITVDNTTTTLYAPTPQNVSATQTLASGTEIGSITIDNTTTTLYAPSGGGGSNVTVTPITLTGTNIADIAVDGTTYQLFAPSGGGGEAIETALVYSTEERVVGVWTDNKPLYAKTVYITCSADNTDISFDTTFEIKQLEGGVSSNNGDMFIHLGYGNSSLVGAYEYQAGTIRFQNFYYSSWPNGRLTMYYTKTTDTPGSGPYITNGSYAHHYSTTEQVIGTWIDGSTLYERVFDLGSDISIFYDSFTNTSIDASNMEVLVDAWGIYSTGATKYSLMANINNNIIRLQTDRNGAYASVRYVILQYTKTS